MLSLRMIPRATPHPATHDDEELVQATLAGNREAFGEIVARYQSLICSLAYSATGNLGRSEDLAQETFLAAWRHLVDLREPAKLRAWLCGIARNVIHGSLRVDRREPNQGAETLDALPEPASPEPLPLDRAIRDEEAALLWNSLERIPETYRVPLVLFYREHQSVEAVARQLDLTDATVRQRLSRGRKLLEAEVLGFVEATLTRSTPGTKFTCAVLAALPGAGSAGHLATLGAAAAKGGSAAHGPWSLAALGSTLALIGAVLLSWKNAVDDARSPAERRLMIRTGWFQVLFLLGTLAVSFLGLPRLAGSPLALGLAIAALLLLVVVVGVLTTQHLNRRRLELAMDAEHLAEAAAHSPTTLSERQANRRALRLVVPFLVLLAGGSLGLPWQNHPLRCLGVVLAEALIVLWAFRRFRRQLRGELPAGSPVARTRLGRFLRHPLVLLPGILFASALVAALLPLFLAPAGAARPSFPELLEIPGLRMIGLGLLLAVVAYAAFAALYHRFAKGRFDLRPEAIFDRTYAPLLRQLNLSVDQATQLRTLVLGKTRDVATRTVSLANRSLTPTQRAEINTAIRTATREHDAHLRRVLGEPAYAAFRHFERTVPDRTLVDQLARRTAGTPAALGPDQAAPLLRALGEARDAFPWTTDFGRGDLESGDYAALFAANNLDTHAAEEERFAREFLERARPILRPDQLAAFESLHSHHRQSRIAGLRAAARLFVP